MAGLGILGDSPPTQLQPPLIDGIHLRWAFKREIGFPWHGYYLFRRRHHEGQFTCMDQYLRDLELEPGTSKGTRWDTPFGQFVSDRPISFTDDFLPSGLVEIDLENRDFLRFILPESLPAYRAKVSIGFHHLGEPPGERGCISFIVGSDHERPNPFFENDVKFEVYGSQGRLVDSRDLFRGDILGLDCGLETVITLPQPASSVVMSLSRSETKPVQLAAFNAAGSIVASASMDEGTQYIRLDGEGIVKLIIESGALAPPDTLLHEICIIFSLTDKQNEIKLTALLDEIPVEEVTVQGAPSEIVTSILEYDKITAVEISSGKAALIDICYVPVSQSMLLGWDKVQDFLYPLCLPVAHADYPCENKPDTESQAEDMAIARIRYGDPNIWRGSSFSDLHQELKLLVTGGPPPTGEKMSDREQNILGTSASSGATDVEMPRQRPLDLVTVGSIQPAIAQMVGLYWIDESAIPGERYDYLILDDNFGLFEGKVENALAWLASSPSFTTVNGYIVFNRTVSPAPPLTPPSEVRAYALPGGTIYQNEDNIIDSTNNVGLRWNLGHFNGILLPDRPIMYHLWRADLGVVNTPPSSPPSAEEYKIITEKQPILVVRPQLPSGSTIEFPPDWPPFQMHTIDTALPEGWYCYEVSGIDIFGRHSPNSFPAQWYQWAPVPDPRPWYYQDPSGDKMIHPFAIGLLDKIPPPPPTGIEAYALDPNDPTLMRDAAYNSWYASLSTEEQTNVIGLRVRWQWTFSHMRQAPDAHEFRIYFHPNHLNALLGRTVSVTDDGSDTESIVETDIPNTQSVNKYLNAWLRVGSHAFKILGSQTDSPLRLRVQNIGPDTDIRPKANTACTIVIPGATSESIAHDLFVDYSISANWKERYYVVGYDEHVTVTTTGNGKPLRRYEIFLPAPGDIVRSGLPLNTSLSEPVVYAHIGVSTADDRPHTLDNVKWSSGNWGNRSGNEGRVGPPVTIFRVNREQPSAPVPPPDSEKVFASPADYHSHSFYTYRWAPAANLKTHVFRALDDALFKVDWSRRPRPALGASDLQFFPSETEDPRWNNLKREQVADELNVLNNFPNNESGREQAMTYYKALSNDALRVLAGLTGNEKAFSQLTIQPLDPNEADPDDPTRLRWRDRVGPDNDSSYTPNATLRAYVDTLDGRSSGRYFYRAAYVDGAHNRSSLSLSSPPVWLRDVVPPRAPIITKVIGGNQQISIRWLSNKEEDLKEYRVFRTSDPLATRDLRLMTLVHSEVVTLDPSTRPFEVMWTDMPIAGLVTFYYFVLAVDQDGNISSPSQPISARAFDESFPVPPLPEVSWSDEGGILRARIRWSSSDETLLQRRSPPSGRWLDLNTWQPPGPISIIDPDADPLNSYEYRIWARKSTGAIGKSMVVTLPGST